MAGASRREPLGFCRLLHRLRLVGHAFLWPREAARHLEDRLSCLVSDDIAGGEGLAVANAINNVADWDVVAARAQEVGVQRVHRAGLDRAVGGGHALCRDKPSEETPFALARVAEQEVAVKLG